MGFVTVWDFIPQVLGVRIAIRYLLWQPFDRRILSMNSIKKLSLVILTVGSLLGCTTQQSVKTPYTEHPQIQTSDKVTAQVLAIKAKAEGGDVYSQYLLGLMYLNGEGVPLNYEKGSHWLKKAALKGIADAQRNLGYLYDKGQGVQQDYEQAVSWYRKAAEQGLAAAQVNLGFCYGHGLGVTQNYKKAVEWYTKAALQGNAMGQHNLARCYIYGTGVPQNFIFGYAWSSLAAAQGHKNAATNRDIVASRLLNSEQLAYAQKLAAEIQYKIEHQTEEPQSRPPDAEVAREAQLIGSGTGFIVTKNGYIISCHHVIADANIIKVSVRKKTYPALVVENDEHNDLALLKISGSFPALAFSSERSARVGQEVFTIGYPNPRLQGINAKFTKGHISSLSGFQDDLRMYQISTPVQPGNSGGPLIDNSGNVIGVIVAMLDAKTAFQISGSLPQNVNYAVKSIYATALLNMLPKSAVILPDPLKTPNFEKAVDMASKTIVMVLAYK
jgi:hypothetical protein